MRGEALVAALDLEGVAVSSGSACAAGAGEPSHVLIAVGHATDAARNGVRFSVLCKNELFAAIEQSEHQLLAHPKASLRELASHPCR